MTTHRAHDSDGTKGAGGTQLLPSPRSDEVVPIVNQSPFVPFLIPWQIRPPENNLAVVVKATFDIVQGADAAVAREPAPPSGDVPFEDQPTSSLRYASDFAVHKPKADVMLVGHALPTLNPGVGLVTFSFGNHSQSIAVFGDRSWGTLGAASKPAPFDQMALRWERAMGGPLSEANPSGRGFKTGVLLPNLERKEALVSSPRDAPLPACFAPISPDWQARKRKLGTFGSKWLQQRWPFFPEDFDWSYFNAAPPEWQLPYLRGDEPFSIDGVLPRKATLSGRLPGIVPRVFAQRTQAAGSGFSEVPLHLDTVWFDTDAMVLVAVWRGLINVRDDEASEISSLLVTSESKAEPLTLEQARFLLLAAGIPSGVWISPAPEPAPAAPPPPPPPATNRKEVLAWVASGQSCAGVDWTGVDLSGANLAKADLSLAILAGADLRGANLSGATLAGAQLASARAQGVVLEGADLSGADLHSASLEGARLSGAKLHKANLSAASCKGADLTGVQGAQAVLANADLSQAKLEGAQLAAADLSGTKLDATSLQKAVLDQARFYGASGDKPRFDGASMQGARMDGVKLQSASFVKVAAPESNWEKAGLAGAVFQEATLTRASFKRAALPGAVFNKAVAIEASFRKAVLSNARMLKADLMQASFEGADLTSADLRGANLYQVETWRAKMQGANLEQANVAGSKLAK